MTRAEQVAICRECSHREMDVQSGLLCSLTHQKANFQQVCANFLKDESVLSIPPDDSEIVQSSEIKAEYSPQIIEKIKMQQNLPLGILSGAIAALLGALIWAIITVATNTQFGLVAVLIGGMVGYAVRISGNGVDQIFGFWGAIMALFGIILGNVFSIIGYVANYEELGYFETLMLIDFTVVPEILVESFSPMDLLFYGIAIYEGYRFSFRPITQADIQKIQSESN